MSGGGFWTPFGRSLSRLTVLHEVLPDFGPTDPSRKEPPGVLTPVKQKTSGQEVSGVPERREEASVAGVWTGRCDVKGPRRGEPRETRDLSR